MGGEEALCAVSALVAYDGTAYHGFQYQVGVPNIQGTLEQALDRCARRVGRVSGAGRTDAGVHARGQVVGVALEWRHAVENLERAWNANLPPAIVVRSVRVAPPGFHPRFSAVSRTYRYTVWCAGTERGWWRSPLTDRFGAYEPRRLDLAAMQAAADELRGSHDFASFGHPPQGESTVRTVYGANWDGVTESLAALDRYPGSRLVFTIVADGFLRQMVRKLVAGLLAVGRGEWTVERLAEVLRARDRSLAPAPVPAHGLMLERVTYPEPLDTLIHGDPGDGRSESQVVNTP
jgi:tRNA pseudouridine38-40 synthase